ncbi:MAG: phosphatidate cytidylyltransferase [bacterium]|nr:MAG: phosphatidate cytidylyltransferase [bacterium]
MNWVRVATAAVLAPAFFLTVWYGSLNIFVALIELICAASFLEFARMAKGKGIKILKVQGFCAALILPLVFIHSAPLVYVVLAVILVSILTVCVSDPDNGTESFIFTIAAVLYIGVCFSSTVLIRKLPDGEKLFLLICFATWGADIGAYYAGRAFGRRKLAPAISPGKTVEGFLGGFLFSFVFGFVFVYFFYKPAFGITMIAAALAGGLIGPLGDLSESMFKRYFGQKDSGAILPGHGGVLDRVDALMLAAPAFYIFLAIRDGLF